MASIKIDGQWMNVNKYETDENGVLLSCSVSRPGKQDHHLVVQREDFGPSDAMQALAAVTAGAAAGAAIADKLSENEPVQQRNRTIVTTSIVGGVVGMIGYALTMKEPGYYDFTTKAKKIVGLIYVKSSPIFRLA